MEDIKHQQGLEIFLGYTCNVKCIFCYQKDLRYSYPKNISPEKVQNLLTEGRYKNKEFVIFSGGEATLDKNLPNYISYAKRLGYIHIRVHTNCFRFSDPAYLEDLYQRGLNGVVVSVHGYREIHDHISTVQGSFARIEKALINFEKLKKRDKRFVFDTNTVICKTNYTSLKILFLFLLKFSISRRMLVYPYNIDTHTNTLASMLPKNTQYLPYVLEVSEIMDTKSVQDFVLETMPYCLIPNKYWKYIEENYKTDKETYYIEGKKDKNIQYVKGKTKFQECNMCIKNEKCYGFSQDYSYTYGKPDFSPITI